MRRFWLGVIEAYTRREKLFNLAIIVISPILAISLWLFSPDWMRLPVTTPRWLWICLPCFLYVIFLCGKGYSNWKLPTLSIVGELRADTNPAYPCFFLTVKNHGPGPVTPQVWIQEIYDDKTGMRIWNRVEAHWRGKPQGVRPILGKNEHDDAGILFVKLSDREAPSLWIYPINLEMNPLWTEVIPLSEQHGIRLSLRVSSDEAKGRGAIERTFLVVPDKTQPLLYRSVAQTNQSGLRL